MEGLSICAFLWHGLEFFPVADKAWLAGGKVREGAKKVENWNVLTPHNGKTILSSIPTIWIARY